MSFTTDATSGIGIPANSTEWADGTLSPYFDVPDNMYKCQEASNTSLADSIGSNTLTKASSAMLWQQTISGWSQKGILISAASGGTVNGFTSSNSNLQINTQSSMWLIYAKWNGTPTASTAVCNLGGGVGVANNNYRCFTTTTPRLTVGINPTADTPDTHDPNSLGVQPIVIQYDKTNQVYRLFCGQDVVNYGSTFVTSDVAATFSVGSVNSTPCGPFYILYMAHWKGSKAEKADWQIRLGLDALGWAASSTPYFNVTFTAALNTTGLAVSDRVDVEADDNVAVSESESESESLAVVYQAKPAPVETDGVTDAVSVVFTAPVALADTADTVDAILVVAQPNVNVNEAVSIADGASVQAQYVANIAEADALNIAESVLAPFATSAALTDNLVVVELLDVVANIATVSTTITTGKIMGYVEIQDTVRPAIVISDRLGEAVDADSTPVMTVYKQGTVMAYSPTVTRLELGVYEAAIVCTTANGFDIDKEYSTFVTATINGLLVKQPGPSFTVQEFSTDDIAASVSNIAVTGAALNQTAASRTITTGTGSGGVANTTARDGVYDALSSSSGTLDFYYQFDLSAFTSAIAVGVQWVGYLVGAVNTLKVYAYNWGGTSWDQVGVINGVMGVTLSEEEWDLTSAHTSAGLVRIRFSNTGLTSATLNTDRILLGYVVQPVAAGTTISANVIQWRGATPNTLVSGRVDADVGNVEAGAVTQIQTGIPAAVDATLTAVHGSGSWATGDVTGDDAIAIAVVKRLIATFGNNTPAITSYSAGVTDTPTQRAIRSLENVLRRLTGQ